MCGRADAYKNAACCMTPACPLASQQSLSLDFLLQFCTSFNHSASYPLAVDCANWTAPPVPTSSSNSGAATAHARTAVDGKAIAGGVGGGVGGLIALSLGGYLVWRRRRRGVRKKDGDGDTADPIPTTAPTETATGAKSDGYDKPELAGREHVPERHELSPREGDMPVHEIAGRERSRNPNPNRQAAAAPNIDGYGHQHQTAVMYPWGQVAGELSGTTPSVSELPATHASHTSELPGHAQR